MTHLVALRENVFTRRPQLLLFLVVSAWLSFRVFVFPPSSWGPVEAPLPRSVARQGVPEEQRALLCPPDSIRVPPSSWGPLEAPQLPPPLPPCRPVARQGVGLYRDASSFGSHQRCNALPVCDLFGEAPAAPDTRYRG